jgi:hypothetical protein
MRSVMDLQRKSLTSSFQSSTTSSEGRTNTWGLLLDPWGGQERLWKQGTKKKRKSQNLRFWDVETHQKTWFMFAAETGTMRHSQLSIGLERQESREIPDFA